MGDRVARGVEVVGLGAATAMAVEQRQHPRRRCQLGNRFDQHTLAGLENVPLGVTTIPRLTSSGRVARGRSQRLCDILMR